MSYNSSENFKDCIWQEFFQIKRLSFSLRFSEIFLSPDHRQVIGFGWQNSMNDGGKRYDHKRHTCTKNSNLGMLLFQCKKLKNRRIESRSFYWLAVFPQCLDYFSCSKTATCGPIHFVGVLKGSVKHTHNFFWFIVDNRYSAENWWKSDWKNFFYLACCKS